MIVTEEGPGLPGFAACPATGATRTSALIVASRETRRTMRAFRWVVELD